MGFLECHYVQWNARTSKFESEGEWQNAAAAKEQRLCLFAGLGTSGVSPEHRAHESARHPVAPGSTKCPARAALTNAAPTDATPTGAAPTDTAPAESAFLVCCVYPGARTWVPYRGLYL